MRWHSEEGNEAWGRDRRAAKGHVCGTIYLSGPGLNLCFISQALAGKISLSLDAWTSSNCYAFLAIVAHYITNEGECGEFFFVIIIKI